MNLIADFKYTRQIFWQKNLPLAVFLIIIMITGVVFGSLAVKTLDYGVKQDLANYFIAFLDGFDEEFNLRCREGLLSLMSYHGRIILLIWVLGLSLVGLPFIPLIVFLRGFVIGFTVGFLVEELGGSGFIFSIAALVPQNILLIPLCILSSLISLAFSWNMLSTLLSRRAFDFWYQFFGYSFLMACCGTGLMVAALIEYYISPYLMDLAVRVLFNM